MNNLYSEAERCFLIADPDEKMEATKEVAHRYLAGELDWQSHDVPIQYSKPGRLDKPELVAPKQLQRRGFNSELQRARLLHALTHIELTAVNLSWDTIYRFRHMPKEYYDDWAQTALEEASHFLALRERIRVLGYDYGDFYAHDELWKSAVQTADDIMDRMAVVHRVLEARALDVVPPSRDKFIEIGDPESARVLTMIANDEVRHVNAGSHWFRYRCEQKGLDPDTTFFKLSQKYIKAYPKGPFNLEARRAAGFNEHELEMLKYYDKEQKKIIQAKRQQSHPTGK